MHGSLSVLGPAYAGGSCGKKEQFAAGGRGAVRGEPVERDPLGRSGPQDGIARGQTAGRRPARGALRYRHTLALLRPPRHHA